MIPAIIPAYNNPEQLNKCIAHLQKQTVDIEICVVDNSVENLYFTAAVNKGLRQYLSGACEYLLLINQDMYLEPTAVEQMRNFMEAKPRCGIAAPLQLHIDQPSTVIFAGGRRAFPTGKHVHGHISEFAENRRILWANGACMLLRKEMIQQIGLLDENFAFIGSDSDYCFTARARQWQIWLVTAARGIHKTGASKAGADENIEKLKIDDMIYFGKKWLTGDLYKSLACEEENYTAEAVRELMAQLQGASQSYQADAPQ